MPRFRVVCTEEVCVEFVVEAPDAAHLEAWLEAHLVDVAADSVHFQQVLDRRHDYKEYNSGADVELDYVVGTDPALLGKV